MVLLGLSAGCPLFFTLLYCAPCGDEYPQLKGLDLTVQYGFP